MAIKALQDEVDRLAAAHGILAGALISVPFWIAIFMYCCQ